MVLICYGQNLAGRPITIGAREQIDLMFNVWRPGSIAQETSGQDGSRRFDAQQVRRIVRQHMASGAANGNSLLLQNLPSLSVRAFDDDNYAAGKALFVRSPQAIEKINPSGSLQYHTVVGRSQDF